jgi:peptidoglycan L-alanyl-D-glutamate endopeptidase CwlK
MTFVLSKRSEFNLVGVDKRLVDVVKLALELTKIDFAVIEGLRSREKQHALYAQGRTSPGKIVTWTMRSKHIDGLAVDLLPATGWDDKKGFDEVARAMKEASWKLGTHIRWGSDWNQNGVAREKGEYDRPHFELV